jgi:aryl sulfotransferase
VLKSRRAFFRRGSSGAGALSLSDQDTASYQARLRELASSDLLAWLDRGLLV